MYAATTKVSPDRSKVEIERLLSKAGAAGFGYRTAQGRVQLEFLFHQRAYRIHFELPNPADVAARLKRNRAGVLERQVQQAGRARWRAMALIVKAKLEAVAIGLSTVEKEFCGEMVMGDNRTMHEHLSQALAGGKVPLALPMFQG